MLADEAEQIGRREVQITDRFAVAVVIQIGTEVFKLAQLHLIEVQAFRQRQCALFEVVTECADHGPCQITVLQMTVDEQTGADIRRSEEHTSELQSLMRISYAVF